MAHNASCIEGVALIAIQQDTTVEAGGVIRIRSDKLTPGSRARVMVMVDHAPAASLPTMRSLIGAAPGGFKSAGEIDAYVRGERDGWQR